MRQSIELRATLALALVLVVGPGGAAEDPEQAPVHYRARLRPPASLAAILEHVEPGRDAFPEEKDAAEIASRLDELGSLLRGGRARDAASLLASDFSGARLSPLEASTVTSGALTIERAKTMSSELVLDRAAFAGELRSLVAGMDEVRVAEFLITRIELSAAGRARTEVRFDVVGSSPAAWRSERVGRFRIDWERDEVRAWRAVSWLALDLSLIHI